MRGYEVRTADQTASKNRDIGSLNFNSVRPKTLHFFSKIKGTCWKSLSGIT